MKIRIAIALGLSLTAATAVAFKPSTYSKAHSAIIPPVIVCCDPTPTCLPGQACPND